jgi:hypothetical protein
MALDIPRYIRVAEIHDKSIRYTCDDADPQSVSDVDDERLIERAEALSFRANLALTIGCAEWVVHRYDALSPDRSPHDYLEAAWAAVVDERYLRMWDFPEEKWQGPIRGPMAVSLHIVQEAVRSAVHEDALGVPLSYMSNLARHVLPKKREFSKWRNQAIKRLASLSPFKSAESLGEPVPREALDLDAEFHPAETEALINRALERLDPNRNPFLCTPDEMVDQHFDGTAYRFSLEEDRRKRAE